MEGPRPPNGLRLSRNRAENWKKFKRVYLFIQPTASVERTEEQKAVMLLHVAGMEAIEMYNTFKFNAGESQTYEAVSQKFKEYCTPKTNETYERYVFRTRKQQEGESFEQFLRDVQLQAQSCKFRDLTSSMIRDQVVYGVTDKKQSACYGRPT